MSEGDQSGGAGVFISTICEYCQRDMLACVSCIVTTLTLNDRVYERVPFGREDRDRGEYDPQTCPDCAAPLGGWHHVGCDWEECPACGGQLLGCLCHLSPIEVPPDLNSP